MLANREVVVAEGVVVDKFYCITLQTRHVASSHILHMAVNIQNGIDK